MQTPASQAVSEGIPTPIRRAIRKAVLDLRTKLEDDFRRQLAALGIDESGTHGVPGGRVLRADEQRARAIAEAVIAREVAGGSSPAQALTLYLDECAYTFLNWAYGFRCLEERGLLLVDGRTETLIRSDPERGSSSLYWRSRSETDRATAPREVWRQAFRRGCEAISEQVRVLFDPESEYAALFPLQPTLQAAVEALNAAEIPPETYAQDELLGWVYQYFNATRKDEVFAAAAKGKKIEGQSIIAATQLYTERYMVDFLLQNSLGALWVEMHPETKLPERWPYYVKPGLSSQPPSTSPPAPLRRGEGRNGEGDGERPLHAPVLAAGLHPSSLGSHPSSLGSHPSSLGSHPSSPALLPQGEKGDGDDRAEAGGQATAAKRLREVTVLDPACGSGHFLLRAADLLAQMYAEEGVEKSEDIPQLILEHNLYGIDIDQRAVQIAALALYMKVAELAGGPVRPRRLNLVAADAQLSGNGPAPEYMARFQGDREEEGLVRAIWQGLRNVRELGSLLHPERLVDEVVAKRRERERGSMWEQDDDHWERWKRDLLDGLREEFERQAGSADLGQRLFGEEAVKGVSLVELLSRRYDVVCANPPFMGSKNMGPPLKNFVAREYAAGKRDLYAAFILRCRELARPGGYVAMVTQQSWMFLSSFAELRGGVLASDSLRALSHHGRYAFSEIGNAIVQPALVVLRCSPPASDHTLTALRLTAPRESPEQARMLADAIAGVERGVRHEVMQAEFTRIPGKPFVYWLRGDFLHLLRRPVNLGTIAEVKEGLGTRDDERFLRFTWEVPAFGVLGGAGPVGGRWFR